ncbi:hypothetical protein LOK49_LG05G02669 [Camellia lanceoleosa]|uniref:Uncharacterized protein n=1 Tax=Camellia lanceoleosa TaxID=1840588 RepID=A0ACC0HRY2_9ERIC|nr:hypothetical protein LOK49_LG05G02669 [Camellia lanceoleosa]
MWWWRKVPKSAMEKLKPWDEEERLRRMELARSKCESELDKVDWNLMKKHMHTPEALEAYEKLCSVARSIILEEVPDLINRRRPDPYLKYYYGAFPYLPFKERLLLKWTGRKNLLQKRLLKYKNVGMWLAVVLVAYKLGGYEKKKEN